MKQFKLNISCNGEDSFTKVVGSKDEAIEETKKYLIDNGIFGSEGFSDIIKDLKEGHVVTLCNIDWEKISKEYSKSDNESDTDMIRTNIKIIEINN